MVPIMLMGLLLFFFLSDVPHLYSQGAEEPCPKPYIKTLSPKAAKPGDELKIRGSRFGKERGIVTFTPGLRAPIQEWTFRRIFVIVPQGTKTGPVSVTTPCGETSNEVYFMIKSEEQ